jgi:hypothetical protein
VVSAQFHAGHRECYFVHRIEEHGIRAFRECLGELPVSLFRRRLAQS